MQSLSPLHSVLNEPPSMYQMDKIVTNIPVTFSILEFSAVPVALVIVDLIFTLELAIIWPLLFWAITPLLFYVTNTKVNMLFVIRFIAFMKGFIEPGIITIGAQIYKYHQLHETYMYFMFIYCAYQAGLFGAQLLIPIDIIENNCCGDIDCLTQAIVISSGAACLACTLYIGTWTYFATHKPITQSNLHVYKMELYKLSCLLFILMPYAIFWLFYHHIIPQLNELPKLINLFILSTHDVPRLYTTLKFIIAIIYYYLVYKRFSKFILIHSALLMTIGGVLLGLWPIIGAPMVVEHEDQYYQVGPVKPDAIHITYLCPLILPQFIDIPYYQVSQCNNASAEHVYHVHHDQVFVTREENACPEVWSDYNRLRYKYCFRRGTRYLFYICDADTHFIVPERARRDSYGVPVVCVVLQNELDCINENGDTYLELNKNGTNEHEAVQYTFTFFTSLLRYQLKANQTPKSSYSCQNIEPGKYHLDPCFTTDEVEFKAGGAYIIFTHQQYSHIQIHTTVEPFKSTILNTRLIPLYIIRAIGEFLLITNGFYFVFIQVHPKFRPSALAIWFMLIKFGSLMYEIECNTDEYFHNGDLHKLGLILIGTTILSYILQLIINF